MLDNSNDKETIEVSQNEISLEEILSEAGLLESDDIQFDEERIATALRALEW